MNCKAVESRLSAYLDGELTGHEMLCVREHLSRCFECRTEETSLRGLKRMLCGLESAAPPPGFEARLSACVLRDRPVARVSTLSRSILLFAGVAGCTMLITLEVQRSLHGPIPEARPAVVAKRQGPSIESQVRDDEMISTLGDPMSGSAVWSAAESR